MFWQTGNSLFLILFNLPFLIFAYRSIGKVFVMHMLVANFLFSGSLVFIATMMPIDFLGESLEVVVIGGAILGVGLASLFAKADVWMGLKF